MTPRGRIRKVLQHSPEKLYLEAIRQYEIRFLNEALVSPMWITYTG